MECGLYLSSLIIEIILKLQGIIGAITGVAVTLIVTHILKNFGKIHFYFHNWRLDFISYQSGGREQVSISDKASNSEYFFEMEIINTSESKKYLRDIKVKFYNNKKLLLQTIPKNESTKKVKPSGTIIDPLKIINLEPKSIVYYKISGYFKEEDLPNLMKCNKVYFESLIGTKRKVKKLIGKI